MEIIKAHRPTMWPKGSKWYELHYLLHHTCDDKEDVAIRVMDSDVEGGFSFEMKNNLRDWVRNQNLSCAKYQAQYRIGAQWEHDRTFYPEFKNYVKGTEDELLPAGDELAVVVWRYDMDEWFETPNT
jgi:hypothetical protein